MRLSIALSTLTVLTASLYASQASSPFKDLSNGPMESPIAIKSPVVLDVSSEEIEDNYFSPRAPKPKAKKQPSGKRSRQDSSVDSENAQDLSQTSAVTDEPEARLNLEVDEVQQFMDRVRAIRDRVVAGHPSDVILPADLASIIKARQGIQGELHAKYQDIRLLTQHGIRYVVLDTEWDRARNITEISAIEFIEGKRSRVIFKKYDNAHPAKHDLRSILEFIKDDPTSEHLTITIAHNAPADIAMLFHELNKHYDSPSVNHPRILENEGFKTYWLDTYRYLNRKWQISEDIAAEQVEIKTVEFSYPEATRRKNKAKEDKQKRESAKKRKQEKERQRELRLIAAGNLNPDGSLVDDEEEKKPSSSNRPKKPSFKLADAFNRTGVSMPTLLRRLNMDEQLAKEKGISGAQFDAHNALFDIIMTSGIVFAECDQQRRDYPTSTVKSLFPVE